MMMQEGEHIEIPKFDSPSAELEHIQSAVVAKKESLGGAVSDAQKKEITSQVIHEYARKDPTEVLAEHVILDNPEYEHIVRSVDSLPHREKMRELYRLMQEKGVLNAIRIAAGLDNPHVEEDFHHVLVQYVHTGSFIPGLDKEKEVKQELERTVYEILVPLAKQAGEVDPATVLSSMQRFLSGIFGPGAAKDALYSFEIALANYSSHITFYVSVPDTQKDLFLKQFLGNFPTARATEMHEDYNIFNEFGATVVGVGRHEKRFAYVLALPQNGMESLAPVVAAFQKIAHEGEAASVQYLVRPDDRKLIDKTRAAIGKIRNGASLKEATDIPLSFGGDALKFVGKLFSAEKEKTKEVSPEEQERRNRETKVIEEKIAAPFLRVDFRIVVSAETKDRAMQILQALTATYGQFTNRESSGGIRFDTYTKGSLLSNALHDYIYRIPNDDAMVLNFNELAALFHPPLSITDKEAPTLASIKAAAAPPPIDLPEEGTIMGESVYRGERKLVRMTKQDRLRHMYVIGQTGTGKTTILKNMIIEDIKAGEGCCFIDPHGSDVQDILANIPKERIDDVIYFDPSQTARPFGLNMLEYDTQKPEQKIFVVNELFAIFKKLYAHSPESMGPAFEQYFRNATMLVMEDPASGNTMIDIMRVMADPAFRELKLSRCRNPIVVQFWRDIAAKTTGETGLQNMIPYIVNKFDVFISNDIMRPIIAQEESSFNFRDVMDKKKILLVNLAKGKLGEMNANLLGMIIVGKIFLAAMSRVDSYGTKLPDFYLYIDEFQNISTPSIAGILSEARKYGLSLNIAHQFIAQIDQDIKDAVFGNVGSMVVYRISADDAQYLESHFAPTFVATDLMKIENFNAYVKLLVNSKPVTPFNIRVFPPSKGVLQIVEQMQQLSFLKFGRDRAQVDGVILKKYQQTSTASKQGGAQALKPAVPATVAPRPTTPSVQPPVSTPVLPQRPPVLPPSVPPQGPLHMQYPVPPSGQQYSTPATYPPAQMTPGVYGQQFPFYPQGGVVTHVEPPQMQSAAHQYPQGHYYAGYPGYIPPQMYVPIPQAQMMQPGMYHPYPPQQYMQQHPPQTAHPLPQGGVVSQPPSDLPKE